MRIGAAAEQAGVNIQVGAASFANQPPEGGEVGGGEQHAKGVHREQRGGQKARVHSSRVQRVEEA